MLRPIRIDFSQSDKNFDWAFGFMLRGGCVKKQDEESFFLISTPRQLVAAGYWVCHELMECVPSESQVVKISGDRRASKFSIPSDELLAEIWHPYIDLQPLGSWVWAKKRMMEGEKARLASWRDTGHFAIAIRKPQDLSRLLDGHAEFSESIVSKLWTQPFVPFIAIKYQNGLIVSADLSHENCLNWEIVEEKKAGAQ